LQHKQNRKETTRQQRELEAESVSYAVPAAKQPATLFGKVWTGGSPVLQ
jgi:hypothetical protein